MSEDFNACTVISSVRVYSFSVHAHRNISTVAIATARVRMLTFCVLCADVRYTVFGIPPEREGSIIMWCLETMDTMELAHTDQLIVPETSGPATFYQRMPVELFTTVLKKYGRLSTQCPGFDPRSDHVGFTVDKVALGYVFSGYFSFPCQFSFHQLLHIC
jgi:hypothetical protein